MDIQELERIGLLKNDRKVYLALLEIGSATASDLMKKTGLHRSYIYDILDKLIDLGLVGFIIKNNKKYFSTENPERIIEYLQSKEQEIKTDKEDIEKIIPELIKKHQTALEKQEARIFIGNRGIKTILEDILTTKRDFVGFGAEGKFKDIFKWYFDNWQKRRLKLKISYKILYNEKLKGKRPTKEQKLVEVRFISKEYEFPATTIVYGNKVAIILWNDSPIGFLLENDKISKSFHNYFRILWNMARK